MEEEKPPRHKRVIGIFTLAMINVAIVGSVKNWPITAEYGFSSIFYLILSTLIFFVPVALVAAELATAWPEEGGLYVWVKEAFGHRTGFLAIWLVWIQTIAWYPTILSFIASSLAYVFDPELASNTWYNLAAIIIFFWLATIASMQGMKISGLISTVGGIFGTFLPAALIIGLGIAWFFEGNPSQISFTWDALVPDLTSVQNLVFFTGILTALAGMEMSAVHARDVRHPQRDYPKALLLSGILIIGLSILGVLAIAMVVPQKQISLTAASLQAFAVFVNAYSLQWAVPVVGALITIGAFVSLTSWTVAPIRGLLAAAKMGDLPHVFHKINKHEMPKNLLIFQAVIVSILSLVFLLMPSVNSAYWILMALVTEIYMIAYLMMFAAAIKLRVSKPDVARPYKIPGGTWGIRVVAGLGLASSLFAIAVGLFPPSQIPTGNEVLYVAFLVISTVILCLGPSIILLFKKPSWRE